MKLETVHIIGAGLAGLSAATVLAGRGRRVMLYEASHQAGGRCRSYYDAALKAVIDNGNHLLLSGNHAASAYLNRIGGSVLSPAVFHFIDAQNRQRWTLDTSKGLSLCWMAVRNRRLRHSLLLAALNTHPDEASAGLTASVLRRTLLKGGSACIPLLADGLSATFIEPALAYLAARDAGVAFNHRLARMEFSGDRATALYFAGREPATIEAGDDVICAVPPWDMPSLVPGITAPDCWRSILNAHFRIAPPVGFPRITGVLNGTVEWVFAFPERISITISNAGRMMWEERETLAVRLWQEVSSLTGLADALPPWQIVKERRATFAATSEQDKKRPGISTPWRNLYLAGDWVQTGLPATIEGAILSGKRAATMILDKHNI